MRDESLIFDFGMHKGEDADFYLKKGFRVVGVEADPGHASHCERRFEAECREGRLVIVNKAVAEAAGTIDFHVNDSVSVWGTADPEWMLRNRAAGTNSRVVQVDAVRAEDLLREYGVPYYMKVDIEGFDHLCLEALAGLDDRPRYVSVESHAWSYDETAKLIDLLCAVGYRSFCIVPQRDVAGVRCPRPALEGQYVDHVFPEQASGLFGRELPGPWMSAEEAKTRFRTIYAHVRMTGHFTGMFRRVRGRRLAGFLDRLFPDGRNWFDIHAATGEDMA